MFKFDIWYLCNLEDLPMKFDKLPTNWNDTFNYPFHI